MDPKLHASWLPPLHHCPPGCHKAIAVVARHAVERLAVWNVCILHITAEGSRENY
jgi:hypothetical protein